jgi:D-alanyl-D-alanine carboxypeptidase (penicillin-binding protein 5/6)
MMSSKYNSRDPYAGGQEETRRDAALSGTPDGGERVQLSAEEIAAVLAESYFGGKVVTGDEDSGREDSFHTEETLTAEKEREARRRQRVQEMRRRKKRQEQLRRLMLPGIVAAVVFVILAGLGIGGLVRKLGKKNPLPPKETSVFEMAEDSSAESEMAEDSSADSTLNEDDPNGGADKKITYAGMNIAGCYVNSDVADTIAEELALADTLIVRTLGGRSLEPRLEASTDEGTALPGSEVVSENVVFIDVEAGRILGQRGAQSRIPPASMTKILTVLVAAEHITDPDDTFEITQDIVDYSFVNRCSNAGFEVGEKVTVNDLFYGTVLPSGGEAAVALAVYVSGSQEAFVELMNEKLEELGISATTHFTNCVGIYDDDHYSTVYDMAVILKAAYDNSYCREVLGVRTYKTSVTEQHPEGIDLSNLFLRRIEDRDTHGEVLCAKTGYVDQSGNCAASLGIGNDGKRYICVTAHANDTWSCIRDHVALYQQFLPE